MQLSHWETNIPLLYKAELGLRQGNICNHIKYLTFLYCRAVRRLHSVGGAPVNFGRR